MIGLALVEGRVVDRQRRLPRAGLRGRRLLRGEDTVSPRLRDLEGAEDAAARAERRREHRALVPLPHHRALLLAQTGIGGGGDRHRLAALDRQTGHRPLLEGQPPAAPLLVGLAVHPRGEALDDAGFALGPDLAAAGVEDGADAPAGGVEHLPQVEAGAELQAELVEQPLAARPRDELLVALLQIAVHAGVVHGRGRLVGQAAGQLHLLAGEPALALGLADHEETERRAAEPQRQRQAGLLAPPLHGRAALRVEVAGPRPSRGPAPG